MSFVRFLFEYAILWRFLRTILYHICARVVCLVRSSFWMLVQYIFPSSESGILPLLSRNEVNWNRLVCLVVLLQTFVPFASLGDNVTSSNIVELKLINIYFYCDNWGDASDYVSFYTQIISCDITLLLL